MKAIDCGHNVETFIRKLKSDKKMKKKPDWHPTDVMRRLSYKNDKYWLTRQKKRLICDDLLAQKEFRLALNLKMSFFCCIKTKNLNCEKTNERTLRLVFQKNI